VVPSQYLDISPIINEGLYLSMQMEVSRIIPDSDRLTGEQAE